MGLRHARYDLARWHGEPCSASPLFTGYDIGFVTFAGMYGSMPFEKIAAAYADFGAEARESFAGMAVFDALVANDDRHSGNFGFLIDNRTRTVVSAAPIFDNNLSLFIRDVDADLNAADLAQSAAWCKSPSNVLLNYRASYMMTDDLRDRLAGLRGFEFEPHPELPLDECCAAL